MRTYVSEGKEKVMCGSSSPGGGEGGNFNASLLHEKGRPKKSHLRFTNSGGTKRRYVQFAVPGPVGRGTVASDEKNWFRWRAEKRIC